MGKHSQQGEAEPWAHPPCHLLGAHMDGVVPTDNCGDGPGLVPPWAPKSDKKMGGGHHLTGSLTQLRPDPPAGKEQR